MPGREQTLRVVREWVAKAEDDLVTADHTLKLGRRSPTSIVCFHAQQCVEKYIKALLTLQGVNFPKTHDVEQLVALIPPRMRPGLTVEDQRQLTGYATGARYPGSPPISLAEAREAVSVARRVRAEIRRLLPAEVLRK
jgi:HEPN domain-containing protein